MFFLQAGFKVVGKTNDKLYFSIPSCRNDINREIDLIEEYSRFIGYKNFNKIKPVKQLKYSKNTQKSLNIIKEVEPLIDLKSSKRKTMLNNFNKIRKFKLAHCINI